MRLKFEPAITGVLVIAALGVAASSLKFAFGTPKLGQPAAPDYVATWRNASRIGHVVAGDSTAPVTLVVFVDLQCPVCAMAHPALANAAHGTPLNVRVIYVPYPLTYHRYARGAAIGAQCAAAQGHFEEWVDAVFKDQEALGVRSWVSFAKLAHVRDTADFTRCMQGPASQVPIDSALAVGQAMGIDGTPTVLVNGWRLHIAINTHTLDSAAKAVVRPRHLSFMARILKRF